MKRKESGHIPNSFVSFAKINLSKVRKHLYQEALLFMFCYNRIFYGHTYNFSWKHVCYIDVLS